MLAPEARNNTTELMPGTIFIQEGLLLPELLQIESSAYSQGWRVVNSNSRSLDQQIAAVSWNFFFTAGSLHGSAFGRKGPLTLRNAMHQILTQVQKLNFNAVEIATIEGHRMLGLFPYITMSANARHIQRSEQLDNDGQRKMAHDQSTWALG